MLRVFKKLAGFFHRHPGVKTTVVGGLNAAITAATAGFLGPEAAGVAAAIQGAITLWTKRPKDATEEDKRGESTGEAGTPPE